ncbi:MAG: N-6 DNA methylase [Ginsengibacter sp.]
MLAPGLQKEIDEKWNACWPLSELRPIAIIDLVSYLFFFKRISEFQPKEVAEIEQLPYSFNSNPKKKLLWDTFKNLGIQEMHELVTTKGGIVSLVKNYDKITPCSTFLKGNLLLTPTPKSLNNATGILKIIEGKDEDTSAEILKYLLNKTEIKATNGQTWLPEDIVTLMVSIIQPDITDVIMDPSAGNGSLLAGCAKYIVDKNSKHSNDFKKSFDFKRFTGVESDVTNLRVSAMNMILNGLDISRLKTPNNATAFNLISKQLPTLFISDLLFSLNENKIINESGFLKEGTKNEITSLDFILKNTKPGTRVAVTVPWGILFNIGDEFKMLRREIIEKCKLDAVITLNDTTLCEFAGAAILIFHKETSAVTDKVWFYKLKNENIINKKIIVHENNFQNNVKNFSEEEDEQAMILNHFTNNGTDDQTITAGFYIEVDKIKSNNYNLSYNEYNMGRDKKISLPSETANPQKTIKVNNYKKQLTFFTTEKKIVSVQNTSLKKNNKAIIFSIAVICFAFLAYFFLKPQKEFILQQKPGLVSTISNDSANHSSLKNNVTTASAGMKSDIPPIDKNLVPVKYTVISKAYFYSAPKGNTRQNDYINHWSNAVLTPEKEKNGFVYVVYINNPGQKLSGWLNKKDLEAVD